MKSLRKEKLKENKRPETHKTRSYAAYKQKGKIGLGLIFSEGTKAVR